MVDFRELIKNMKPMDPKIQAPPPEYPPFFEFEETGDFVGGVLSDLREIEQKDGRMSKVMTITTSEGDKYSIGLSANLRGLATMEGKRVVIKYLGVKRVGKNYPKQFEVYE